MLKITHAGLLQVASLYNLRQKLKQDKEFTETLEFYCIYEGSLILQLILGNVYSVFKGSNMCGWVVIDKRQLSVHYLPTGNYLTINELMELLTQRFICLGYQILIKYHNVDIDTLKSKYSLEIHDNLMYMSCNRDDMGATVQESNTLLVRNLVINKEEMLRIDLQNNIFSNIKNRSPLTMGDILYEESSSKFMKDLCFVLEEYRVPIGYGQILRINGAYYLVNFGVVDTQKRKGYGYFFLHSIMRTSFYQGIEVLNLSVDRRNDPAIGLYRKMGFLECYNTVTFEFR